jgi:hypothetical protein
MKLNKSILAAALALGMAGLSHAGTVYITGSTAMRGTVFQTLTNVGAVFSSSPTVTLYTGGTTGNNAGNGATYMAFQGTLVGGSGTTTIECAWSGSEAGIKDVATGLSENFIDPSLLDGNDHGTNVPATLTSQPVDLAMGDNAQAYSRTKTPVITANTEVGVITFKWVRNNGLWTGSNVTASQIRQALNGFCPRAVFDGNSADVNDYVYVSGRDNQSGTRVNTFGDSLYGIFSSPSQIEMNSSGVMQLVGGNYAGDFGYSGGGSLAATMGANTTTAADQWNGKTGYSVIAYLSVGDAATAIANGATELTYNGVAFSPAAVKEGTYTFWGNEYIYKKNSDSNTDAGTVYSRLSLTSTGISHNCDGTKAISLSAMDCTRTGPTTDPVHN